MLAPRRDRVHCRKSSGATRRLCFATWTTVMSTPATPLLVDLQLFGDLCLRDLRTGARLGEPRRKPLVLLAVLVTEAPNTVARDALLPLLWPELDAPHARRALAQTLYALRQQLGGADMVVGTTHLTVAPQLTSDLARWRSRYRAGDREGCRREFTGSLLDGVQVRGGSAFDRWCAAHRAHIEAQHAALVAMSSTPVTPSAPATSPTPTTSPTPAATPSDRTEPAWRSPAPTRQRRRIVGVAALAVAGALLAVTWGNPQPDAATATGAATADTAPPATVAEEWKRTWQAEHAARLAATDSSRIGRVLLLSTRNVSRAPALDSLLPGLDATLRMIHESEFAQPVAPDITQALEQEAAEWRLPVTTDMHMARMLASSGAGLVVRPMLHARGDTLSVSFVIYRSIAHTAAARANAPNVEWTQLGGQTTVTLDQLDLQLRAMKALVHFTRSLERCAPDAHSTAHSAPWCWRTPTALDLVPGTLRERQNDWFAVGRARRAELAAP